MKKYILFITLFFCVQFYVMSQSQADADKAYAQNDFQKAAKIYGDLLSKKESSALYYNLGNCYYRLGLPSKALLNYERAALLNPSDKDIQANIEFLNTQLSDKTTRPTKFFFVIGWEAFRNSMNLQGWILIGILTFILFLTSIFLYLFSKSMTVRKISFFSGLFFLLVCIISNHFAYSQYRSMTQRNTALIMTSGATVRSAPTETGTALTTLPEGLKIHITDSSMRGWKEIEFDNDKKGWVKDESIEII